MRPLIVMLVLLSFSVTARAQKTYSTMTRTALETMWEYQGNKTTKFDSLGYRLALRRYQEAFTEFPDSIEWSGLYKASVLAGELGTLDTAFLYLEQLLSLPDPEGTRWRIVVGKYGESDYSNLLPDPRWRTLVAREGQRRDAFYAALRDREEALLAAPAFLPDTSLSGAALYQQLSRFENYLPKEAGDYSVSLPINDSTATSYLVHLPPGYSPQRQYAVLVFLHGAVRRNALVEYQTGKYVLTGDNRFYTEYADSAGVILVFPKGSRDYNWMTSDAGFFMVPTLVRQLKQSLNVDDNKVFVTGHSNGATGSFSYLMKQPTLFAGFYGFNTYPKVFTGGTFLENALNRPFLNFSTDQDYYYPAVAHDSLSLLLKRIGADYRDVRFAGFPHWFPRFDESEEAFALLFTDLARRERDPYPTKLTWEFDDNYYGTVDWLADMKLDTLAEAAVWHQPSRNFVISEWLEYDDRDSLVTKVVDREAFDFPRRSGKVVAEYADNTFRLKTSRISDLTIRISPEMVDMDLPVRIYVNGTLAAESDVRYDKQLILGGFKRGHDREQLWVDVIQIHRLD
ncbi:alpha/beta hydrolase-fold protein [Lewinella sp. IMCC34191]|uniref:alpha/beta hydrolase-fold protein n=1 Tax=Lewinella sp. IMCC34191 TaxID=2259172 RepID=UPI0018E4E545|nr:alpha/beta hydrolase-fold protein [Lewinella sp. IMCC34191]